MFCLIISGSAIFVYVQLSICKTVTEYNKVIGNILSKQSSQNLLNFITGALRWKWSQLILKISINLLSKPSEDITQKGSYRSISFVITHASSLQEYWLNEPRSVQFIHGVKEWLTLEYLWMYDTSLNSASNLERKSSILPQYESFSQHRRKSKRNKGHKGRRRKIIS